MEWNWIGFERWFGRRWWWCWWQWSCDGWRREGGREGKAGRRGLPVSCDASGRAGVIWICGTSRGCLRSRGPTLPSSWGPRFWCRPAGRCRWTGTCPRCRRVSRRAGCCRTSRRRPTAGPPARKRTSSTTLPPWRKSFQFHFHFRSLAFPLPTFIQPASSYQVLSSIQVVALTWYLSSI